MSFTGDTGRSKSTHKAPRSDRFPGGEYLRGEPANRPVLASAEGVEQLPANPTERVEVAAYRHP